MNTDIDMNKNKSMNIKMNTDTHIEITMCKTIDMDVHDKYGWLSKPSSPFGSPTY